ncbi:MAG: S-layer homology domain-containing protein [Firmicutes bacterium]|nr:S-layer homology domain-containing protein [Bacillota bacterium]
MKLIRKSLLLLVLSALLLALCAVGVSAAPSLSAYSAVVLDADTGVYYYEKNADTRRAQASMTKLMTAYMIFEEIGAGRLNYDSVITISSHGQAVSYTGGYSNVPLNKGEQYTVDTMLKLILLPSACGACASMADAISGSESAFVANMNQTAKDLGLNAHFTNTYGAGVGMPNHYISARSMADLGRIFIEKYPDILKYTSLNSVYFKGNTYYNTNHFLNTDYYAGVDGMKTGTNGEAGSCITVSAQKNGRRIMVVVMKSGARYADARKLLDYGFACVAENDAKAAEAAVALSSLRQDIRLGADFNVTATVSGLSSPVAASGGWMVNGEVVATFPARVFANGTQISTSLAIPENGAEGADIAFFFALPEGNKVMAEAHYAFGSEAPCAFRDVDMHWAEDAITLMKNLNVLTGYPDGTFQPDKAISRGEFVAVLVRLLQTENKITVDAQGVSGFEDCANTWVDPYVAAAKAAGITTGVTETTFCPDQPVSRQEMSTFIARALGYEAVGTEAAFTDAADIAPWALPYVIACVEHEVLNGYPEGTFLPEKNASRAEVSTLLARVHGLF